MLRTMWWIFLAANSALLTSLLSFMAGISFSAISLLGIAALCSVGMGCFYLFNQLAKKMGNTGLVVSSLVLTALAGLALSKVPTNAMIVNSFTHHPIASILGLCLFYTTAFIGISVGAIHFTFNIADKFYSWISGGNSSKLVPSKPPVQPEQPTAGEKSTNKPGSSSPNVGQSKNTSNTRTTGTPFSFHRPAAADRLDEDDTNPALRSGSSPSP